ncbi:hypothetical protein [Rhodococcus jostii]|nr:hypothetical protein [Rhodococcus jostii]
MRVHRSGVGGEQQGAGTRFEHLRQHLLRRADGSVEVVIDLGL